MTLTLLFTGAAVALGFLYAVALRGASPSLAGEQTAIGLGDPASDTLTSGNQPHAANRTDWQMTTVNDLTAAEDLLDCLENHGAVERELVVLGNSCFAVRWR